jgi:hypothetical protein
MESFIRGVAAPTRWEQMALRVALEADIRRLTRVEASRVEDVGL